ncbi:MAG: sigma-54 dependent transcriptional regulator [Planctomycetota bacterium]|nr:sigma-54 dependent transcriptional regulator [Planctomycetota bacterium]
MAETKSTALKVLVVDDDPSIARIFKDLLASDTVTITAARSGEEAIDLAAHAKFDIAFVDRKLPGMSGDEVIESFRCSHVETEIVVITGYGTVESAVNMMKLGVFDYLPKPFKASQIKTVLERVQRLRALRRETQTIGEASKIPVPYENLIGRTPQMQRVHELIAKTGKDDCNILIQGESGTGKEVVAHAVHSNSVRADKPFVTIDCGSISKSLIESELFGHEKGAFTGAHTKKDGLFVKANGGTAFLDEIAEIPLDLQPVLLRCIETKAIRPVGSSDTVQVDVRLVSATNRDLSEMSKRGEFRVDLFYRLNFVTINLPPLRERKDDIPLLVAHCLQVYNGKSTGRIMNGVSDTAMIALFRHDWPGNIRELENVIGRAYTIGSGSRLELSDLPPNISSLVHPTKLRRNPFLGKSLKDLEKEAILAALRSSRGDTQLASVSLGINRSTLYRKLKTYDIEL